MITHGATHLGVATDHIIESFRNRLWRGYKTSAGVPRDLLAQFPILEESLTAWALSCGRWWSSRLTMRWRRLQRRPRRTSPWSKSSSARPIKISRSACVVPASFSWSERARCSTKRRSRRSSVFPHLRFLASRPLGRCGRRLSGAARGGVPSPLPPCWLDSAGSKLSQDDWKQWHVNAASPARLAETLARDRRLALLFRDLATLRTGRPRLRHSRGLALDGPTDRFESWR